MLPAMLGAVLEPIPCQQVPQSTSQTVRALVTGLGILQICAPGLQLIPALHFSPLNARKCVPQPLSHD